MPLIRVYTGYSFFYCSHLAASVQKSCWLFFCPKGVLQFGFGLFLWFIVSFEIVAFHERAIAKQCFKVGRC